MNIQSNENKPNHKYIKNHIFYDAMTATEGGNLGGFSAVYSAASSTEEDAEAAPATVNNCNGGNCARGCGAKLQ
jgi:hypothetical protein